MKQEPVNIYVTEALQQLKALGGFGKNKLHIAIQSSTKPDLHNSHPFHGRYNEETEESIKISEVNEDNILEGAPSNNQM